MTAIGIDLGTTYTCAAFMKDGKAEVIPNFNGHRITPSIVAFTSIGRTVGEAAKQQMRRNPKNAVYDAKRLLGRKFIDPAVQSDRTQWPFDIVNESGRPKIKITYEKDKTSHEISLQPEEIGAALLEKMKTDAESFIGKDVHSAVITVPAYFSDAQRRATKEAAGIAGIHVLGMINEPTAAAIAYGLGKKKSDCRNVLIFDLGGGTFDVTVMEIKEKLFNVLATGGDSHLGGQDFNNRLYSHLLDEFVSLYKIDPSDKVKQKLRAECEGTKRMLSTSLTASVIIDNLHDGEDFEVDVTRARFEQLCGDLFTETMQTVETVLLDADMQKEDINDVVLIGGSTRIPFVLEMLQNCFGADKICKTINPDEAVACGAAVQAAFLSGDVSASIQGLKLSDVTPLSLGIETKGGIMTVIVKRNTKIPTTEYKTIVTTMDNQRSIGYPVFEGERASTKFNNLLGCFTLSGLRPLTAGEAKTEVCFNVDANGVLNVSARDMCNSENKAEVKVTWDKGRFSEAELAQVYETARKFRQEDDNKRQTVLARNELESKVNKGRQIVRQARQGTDSQRYSLENKCKFMAEWTTENPKAVKSDINIKRQELEEAIRETEGIGGPGAEL